MKFSIPRSQDSVYLYRSIIILLCLIGLNAPVHSQTPSQDLVPKHNESKITPLKPYKKLLFVGNSFSFYNNGIHNHLGSLIRANGDWKRGENRLRLQTLSGAHIHEHLIRLDATLSNDTRGWEAVVLQAHSNEAVTKSKMERFDASLAEAIGIVRRNELEPIIFMTWAYENDTEMAQALEKAYLQQAVEHDVPIVPVGIAFAQAAKQLPHISLYVRDVLGVEKDGEQATITYRKDVKHPSKAGTYLAACVFYASLYQRSPYGNLFTAGLDDEDAAALQQLSWDVVSKFMQ